MSKTGRRWLRLLLLLAFFAQGMQHIRSTSLTFDEGPHLAVGYTTLRTGDFRLQPVHIHPPLANGFAALPLLLQDDLPDPRAIDGWDIASLSAITDAVVWQYPHPERLALAGRLPILWLAVLLGALICRWAWDRGGGKIGLLALALYAFEPNSIAHGTLITTDMAATFLVVATLYAAKRQSEKARKRESEGSQWRPGREGGDFVGWMGVGALLGLALLAKVSAVLLVPVLLVIVAGAALKGEGAHNPRLAWQASQFVRRTVALALPAALVLWAGYGFETGSVAGLPFAIPAATHLKIYLSLQEHYTLGHPTFLMGQVSSQGWWYYFPIAFALKTPLPLLIGAAYGLCRWVCLALRQRRAKPRAVFSLTRSLMRLSEPATLVFYVFPIAYAATSLFSTVNIGYRHLLPLLPFLILGVAGSWRGAHFTRPAGRVAQVALLLWLIWGTLAVAPNYLAFFNEIAGGPAGGYRTLVDSNLDWGQNLWQLRDWMAEHDVDSVFYAHYSPARPEAYGIRVAFLPPDPRAGAFTPWQPAPGFYAIGATVLQGPYAPDPNFYAWFRSREPVARLGHALWVYEVKSSASNTPFTYAVLCAETGLSAEQVRANLGQPTLRILQPDCSTAEVTAQGPGLLIRAATSKPVGTPDFVLRAAGGKEAVAIERLEAAPTPARPYPMSTAGPLDFLGYDVSVTPDHAGIEIRAIWRVKERPERPLSLMAHLVAPDGSTASVGDGMGFPIDQWQPGDVLIQRHTLPGALAEGSALRFGGYWLDTMERWTIEGGNDYWEVKP